jgi:formate dehydrogenase major subunit
MGAIPNKLPGFQDVEDAELRTKVESIWGAEIPPKRGWHLTQMFEAMAAGKLRGLYVIGENPADSEADVIHARKALEGLDFMVVQDLFLTRTAEMADVVFPAAADWCESEGTVTSSERRVQRVRKALDAPGEARTDVEILGMLAKCLGAGWGEITPEAAWNELRTVSPMHAGMSYDRLEQLGGIQWPCYDENHPGELFIHSRLWKRPLDSTPAPFVPVDWVPPVDRLTNDFPYRMTTGRHLDGYNTGVQSSGFESPLRIGGTIDISPEDADRLDIVDGDLIRVSSRRGAIDVPARRDPGLRAGLVFMAVHYGEDADVNQLTIEAWDPKSGTAEFKATAVQLQKV